MGIYKKVVENRYRGPILLGLILAVALVLRFIFFTGIGISDSLFYTQFAHNLQDGRLPLEGGHSALRLGLSIPVSILYSAFGVNEFSSNVIPLLISLASIVLMYKFGKLLFNEKTGLIGAFLLSFFPLDVVYATRLMTDLPAAFFVALSAYFFVKAEKKEGEKSTVQRYLLAGVLIGIAYLMKELSLLIGLFFVVYIIYRKHIKSGYFVMAAAFLAVIAAELLFFLTTTGNPFFRYMAVNQGWGDTVIGTNMSGRGSIPFSWLHYPYIIMTDHLLGLYYPFIFLAVAYCIIGRKKEAYIPTAWFFSILIYLNFGSASVTRYVLIPAAARLLTIITIPGLLILAFFLAQEDPLIRKVVMPTVLALLLVTSVGYVYLSEARHDLDNEREAYQYLDSLPKKPTYTDERSTMAFNYLSGYTDSRRIKSFNRYESVHLEEASVMDLSGVEDAYVVVNRRIIDFFLESKREVKFPAQIQTIPGEWKVQKMLGDGAITIYYIP